MLFTPARLAGAFVIDLEPQTDERGFFARSFCADEMAAHGLPRQFPQCNLSYNRRAGTLRGMHYNQPPDEEAKLVRCIRGDIYDVIIDLRPGSPTQHQWQAFELGAQNRRMLFVPKGFAHGFLTLEDETEVFYHMSESYQPEAARGLRYDDPAFSIEWPSPPLLISERDAAYADYVPEPGRRG